MNVAAAKTTIETKYVVYDAAGEPIKLKSGIKRISGHTMLKQVVRRAADCVSPEQHLWLAVVMQAMDDKDAWYFNSPDFAAHCQILGIHPDWARTLFSKHTDWIQ